MILAEWQHRSATGGVAVIYPDGCRDLIRRQIPGQRPEWFVTERDWTARQVRSVAGTTFAGFRMVPGQGVDPRALDLLGDDTDLGAAHAALCDAIIPDPRLNDCLMALESASDLAQACKALGVSLRSLQRIVSKGTGVGPGHWLRLARTRRAAQFLSGNVPLAALACDMGYADQAHMTRDMRAIFGQTPGALRQDRGALEAITQPGWATGEQISTSVPSGVLT